MDTEDVLTMCESQTAVGVNLGINRFATLFDGTLNQGAKSHKALLKRLRCLSRSLSRKQIGSRNIAKAKRKLKKQHVRIKNSRNVKK